MHVARPIYFRSYFGLSLCINALPAMWKQDCLWLDLRKRSPADILRDMRQRAVERSGVTTLPPADPATHGGLRGSGGPLCQPLTQFLVSVNLTWLPVNSIRLKFDYREVRSLRGKPMTMFCSLCRGFVVTSLVEREIFATELQKSTFSHRPTH